MAKRMINVTLAVVVDTDLTSVDNIIDNLKFSVEELSENVEVANTEIVEFFGVAQDATTTLTPTEIKKIISDALDAAENNTIVLDEDTEFYLFDGDTQNELGECFRVEAMYKNERGEIYLSMNTEEYNENPREGWLIDDCSPYEFQLIYENFFNND